MPTHLIILDSAPLVALAAINALDLLNDVTDKVSVSQAARATSAIDAGMGIWIWIDRRSDCEDDSFRIVKTSSEEMATMLIRSGAKVDKELAAGLNRLGAMNVAGMMNHLFEDGDSLIVLSDDQSIVKTFEKNRSYPAEGIRHVTTRGFLDAMERAGMIPSADDVVDMIKKAGITLADDPEGREPLVIEEEAPRP